VLKTDILCGAMAGMGMMRVI